MQRDSSLFDRVLSKVDVSGDCWIWAGGRFTTGYGLVHVPGLLNQRAHRVVYELLVEEIPEGLTLDHLCRNRACVNPDHLEPVTHRENILRGTGPSAINARKTHCIRDHEFTEANTRLRPSGGRVCRACVRADETRRRQARRDAA